MTRREARQKAEALVAQMTLEEKAGQLRYDAPAITRLGVPAYNWWCEALHGVARAGQATIFPQAIGMGATFDPDLVQTVADAIAAEGRAKYNVCAANDDRDIYKGLTFWSPNVNIFRDPRWGRGHETFGEDPYLTGRLGVAYVKGMQGDGDTMKAAACAKHFAVHSGPEALRHEFDARVSAKDMEETYLPAFRALVTEAHVAGVMGAYNCVNGEPACANRTLQEKLRGEWGFDGYFVSDCWAILDFHEHHMVTRTAKESAALAVNTGCDLNCGVTYLHILEAYRDGLVSEETITEAAVRLFTIRYELGLFDGSPYDQISYLEVESPEHLALAEKAAEETFVLLKNNGILPLDERKIRTLGVIGPNADSRASLIGNYHGTSGRYETLQEGLQDYLGDDVRVLTSVGCELERDRSESQSLAHDRLTEAKAVAENSDIVILCVGLDETLEGEEGDTSNSAVSGDKDDLQLPQVQRELMERQGGNIMQGTMKTAVMTDLRKVEIQSRPIPQPKEDEVLVKIEYVGICGSDLHYFESGRIGDFIVHPPFVLGHEAGGTVVELGSKVKNLKAGDRVAMEPGRTCGHCEFCREGKYNLCRDVQFFATPPVDGVFQEYVAHEAGLCFRLPDNVSTMEGALIEPLAVGMHAAAQGDAHLGQTAVVTGAGCIGLVSMLSLKARGVSKVIQVDVMDNRLQKAKELGADFVINGRTEDTVARIMEITGGGGFDIGIETAGSEITAQQQIRSAKKGATIVFVGYSASGMMTLPIGTALDKELTMKTVFRYRNIYPMAIDAVARGVVPIRDVVTNYYELDDIQHALDECVDRKDEVVKGVIKVC